MKKLYLFAIIIAIIVVGLYIFESEYGYKLNFVKPRYEAPEIYSKTTNNSNLDTIWCGTFQIAWNELMEYAGGIVEFEEENLLANELNGSKFTKEMLSENSYYVKKGKASNKLKDEINKELNERFDIKDGAKILDGQNLDNSNGILIYSMLKKNFTFLEKFDDLKPGTFEAKDGTIEKVKIFGIDRDSDSKLRNNVEVLYWDYENLDSNIGLISNEFAVKLKTKENEEVILYRTDKEGTFENLYNELQNLSMNFEEGREFRNQGDELKIPCINIDININYDELCNKIIKNTNEEYISTAIQNIKFNLNSKGGLIFSEAAIITDSLSSASTNSRLFYFNKPFIIFVKENDKEMPYFAMKINNAEYLQIEN